MPDRGFEATACAVAGEPDVVPRGVSGVSQENDRDNVTACYCSHGLLFLSATCNDMSARARGSQVSRKPSHQRKPKVSRGQAAAVAKPVPVGTVQKTASRKTATKESVTTATCLSNNVLSSQFLYYRLRETA